MKTDSKNVLLQAGVASEIAMHLIQQHQKTVFVKIELYDKDLKKGDGIENHTLSSNNPYPNTLEGNLVSDTLNVDSGSKQRRTYSCTFVVTPQNVKNHEMEISPNSTIWIDKYIRVYYGIKNNRDGKTYWWLVGTFTFVTPNYTFSATERSLSISCVDLMADYDGTKGGAIYDYSQNQAILGDHTTVGAIEKDPRLRLNMSYAFNIRAGVTMNRAIEATLALANIPQDRYRIENYYGEGGHNEPYKDNTFLSTVPYDLQFNVGQTWCDVWNQLAELYSSWEFFFDIDGTFVWRRIPTGKAESVVLTNKILEPLLISEKHDNSFRGIYNATEVWGKSLELTQHDRYAETSTYSNNVYTVDVVEVEQYNVTKNRDKIESWWTNTEKLGIHIQAANTQKGFKVRIRGHLDKTNEALYDTVLDVVDGDGNPIDAKYLLPDKSYVFTYRKTLKDNQTTSYLVLNGLTQAYGYYVENNPDCPYSFKSLGYLIPQRITAEALPNDAQCAARAARLTYLSCAMQDTISLETLIIPWLDVNKKISYVSQLDPDRDKLLKGKESELPQYIIKNFSWSTMNGTMSLNAYRFREDYTYVVNN